MAYVDSLSPPCSPELRLPLTVLAVITAIALAATMVIAPLGSPLKCEFIRGGFGTGPYGVLGYSVSVDRHECRIARLNTSPILIIHWTGEPLRIELR